MGLRDEKARYRHQKPKNIKIAPAETNKTN